MATKSSKQLIIASLSDDPYYKESFKDIELFVKEMADKTSGLDDFLVVLPKSVYKKYKKNSSVLPFSKECRYIVVEEFLDLWMRDFGLVLPKKQAKFTYLPKYLKKKDAKYVDKTFTKFLSGLGISLDISDISLDGGNVVDNNNDKAIVSERILVENKGKSKTALKHELENLLQCKVSFIPDHADDTTGHADGMVSFIEDNVLLVADYYDAKSYDAIETAVRSEFPDLTLVRLPFGANPDAGCSKWKGFTSSVGCHVNTLVTNNALYVPQFGSPEYDQKALDVIKQHTSKAIVPVDTSKLSHMGGSVRCMTWQLESSHHVAQILYQQSKMNVE